MCGIVGLFLKDKTLEPELGRLLSEMLVTMTGRGPDSAGIAIYTHGVEDRGKITVQSQTPETDFKTLEADLSGALGTGVGVEVKSTHAIITLPEDRVPEARATVKRLRPDVTVMSAGSTVEIFKEVGLPKGRGRSFRYCRHVRKPRHRPHPDGHGIGRHDERRAPVLHRSGPVPGA